MRRPSCQIEMDLLKNIRSSVDVQWTQVYSFDDWLTRPPNGFCSEFWNVWVLVRQQIRRLTRWMLQVGARTREAARSFASWDRIWKPACSMSEVSHVAPKAVADWLRITLLSELQNLWTVLCLLANTLQVTPWRSLFLVYHSGHR